jgi:hypothetical protein
MAVKNKLWFSEQVLTELQSGLRNRDEKIDIREVIIRLDSMVNELARKSYFENWKAGLPGLSEHFITTWDDVDVIDQANGNLSYLTIPASYIDLPGQGGIIEIYPKKYYLTGGNNSVIIMTHEQWRQYNSTMAASMQGRLSGWPQGDKFYFSKSQVSKQYGNMGVRLAIRDSQFLSDTDVYPIPADKEQEVIEQLVIWFRTRRGVPTDTIRDGNDKP